LIAAVEKAGLPARAGIASSKLAARVAAGLPDSPRVVPAGEEGEFLAPLPLSRLSPQIEIAATLERWGLRSIGDFARLPPGEVESHLGELGRQFHAAARGLDPRPLEPRLPALSLSEGIDLEWPLVTLEPFLFVGNAALERLTGRLESQGLACRRLELTLRLDPDGCDARAILLPAPTREAKTLLTLVRLELEARLGVGRPRSRRLPLGLLELDRARADRVHRAVAGDAKEPARELGIAAERSEEPERPQERLLGDVLGERAVAREVAGEPPHVRLIGAHELLERAEVPLAGARERSRVRVLHRAPLAPAGQPSLAPGPAARYPAELGERRPSPGDPPLANPPSPGDDRAGGEKGPGDEALWS
jgi:protein ImuB